MGIKKEITFQPECTKKDGAKVTGTVNIRRPSVVEKYAYIDELGIKVDDIKQLEGMTEDEKQVKIKEMSQESSELKRMVFYLSKVENHVVSLDLVKTGSKEKIQDVDYLLYDPDCEPICMEIAVKLITGFPVSKN